MKRNTGRERERESSGKKKGGKGVVFVVVGDL